MKIGFRIKKGRKNLGEAISTYSFINDFHKPSFSQIMSFDSLKKQEYYKFLESIRNDFCRPG